MGDLVAAGYPPSPLGSRSALVAGRHDEDARPDAATELADLRRRLEAAEDLADAQARLVTETRRERDEAVRERDELLRRREEPGDGRDDDPPTRPTRPSPDRR